MGPEPESSGKPTTGPAYLFRFRASMGPEPESSGKLLGLLVGLVLRQASMGPEPESSGKRSGPSCRIRMMGSFNGAGAGKLRKTNDGCCSKIRALKASMGPEPESSGKQDKIELELIRHRLLQWGRSRKAPENLKFPPVNWQYC